MIKSVKKMSTVTKLLEENIGRILFDINPVILF